MATAGRYRPLLPTAQAAVGNPSATPFSRHVPACTILTVAYDEDLAERIRELLAGEPGLNAKKMFGGLAFLIGGNMSIAASGEGGILVRVDPADSDRLIGSTDAQLAVMRGRPMQGWLRVAPEHLRTKRQLERWVHLGTKYARSLPVKG